MAPAFGHSSPPPSPASPPPRSASPAPPKTEAAAAWADPEPLPGVGDSVGRGLPGLRGLPGGRRRSPSAPTRSRSPGAVEGGDQWGGGGRVVLAAPVVQPPPSASQPGAAVRDADCGTGRPALAPRTTWNRALKPPVFRKSRPPASTLVSLGSWLNFPELALGHDLGWRQRGHPGEPRALAS